MSPKRTNIYQTSSSRETKELGSKFAKRIIKKGSGRGAAVFALQGDLGAGKTTFVQGFMNGLGSKKRSASPTFIIMRRHSPKGGKKFKNVFHMDAYRLKSHDQLSVVDFDKIIRNPENIVLIEWPERIRKALPKTALWLKFSHGKKENERRIVYSRG